MGKQKNRFGSIKRWFTSAEKLPSDVRGDESEARFENMVKELIRTGRLNWARGISRASAFEDLQKKIDFRIRVVAKHKDGSLSEFSIPIQIKSSMSMAREFVAENGNAVDFIVMSHNITLGQLRRLLGWVYARKVIEHKKVVSLL